MGRLCIASTANPLAVGLELRWTLRASGNYNPLAGDSIELPRFTSTMCASGASPVRSVDVSRWSLKINGRPRKRGFFGKTVKTGT